MKVCFGMFCLILQVTKSIFSSLRNRILSHIDQFHQKAKAVMAATRPIAVDVYVVTALSKNERPKESYMLILKA